MKPARMGKLPGVTRALASFQVSWRPPLWVLDTPGVLPPRVDGGWEGAMRLGVLDMLKAETAGLEELASYALHHLAAHEPEALSRWPRAYAIALRGSQGRVAVDGEMRDLRDVAAARAHGGTALSPRDLTVTMAELLGGWLLVAVAEDMGQFYSGYGRAAPGAERPERVPNLHSTSMILLRMVREGALGKLCLDEHPFMVPPQSGEEARRQKEARRNERRSRLGRSTVRRV